MKAGGFVLGVERRDVLLDVARIADPDNLGDLLGGQRGVGGEENRLHDRCRIDLDRRGIRWGLGAFRSGISRFGGRTGCFGRDNVVPAVHAFRSVCSVRGV
jgi:hypothetical protein